VGHGCGQHRARPASGTNLVAALHAAEPQVDVDATALLQNDARGVLVSLINDLNGLYGPFVLAPSTTTTSIKSPGSARRTR
jgi:hypothetical protein